MSVALNVCFFTLDEGMDKPLNDSDLMVLPHDTQLLIVTVDLLHNTVNKNNGLHHS